MGSKVCAGQHAFELAKRLCENRAAYFFSSAAEEKALLEVHEQNLLPSFVDCVIALLDSDDGNLRLGAAELLGAVTPTTQKAAAIAQLEAHLTDTFVRDFTYGGAQGDEDDMRTVAECSRKSIEQLSRPDDGSGAGSLGPKDNPTTILDFQYPVIVVARREA